MCAMIVLAATLGKFGGAFLAARATGQSWRGAAAVGSLMNTRGLMELIILNIGLDLGVISPTLFAMMVIMALVTTMATAPALHFLMPAHREPGCGDIVSREAEALRSGARACQLPDAVTESPA